MPLPRFRFHVFDHQQTIDSEGLDFINLDAALAYAGRAACSIMADHLQTKGEIDLSHWIEIEDEGGQMTVLTFDEVVTVKPLDRKIIDGSIANQP